jgi:hypothetical protein
MEKRVRVLAGDLWLIGHPFIVICPMNNDKWASGNGKGGMPVGIPPFVL